MKKPLKHQETTHAEPECMPVSVPPRNRRARGEPKLFISYLPDGKGGPREDKGSVPLEVDVEAHIEERTDCELGIYRIDKKRSGEFSGEVLFYTKEPLTRARSVGPSETFDAEDDTLDETEAESPGDRLLRSLQSKVDGGRVVVIAKRKADPAGMAFRVPCATDCTFGEVPYDETDPSIDALELSIQKFYGGGRYEIIVRQDGETVGSVLRTIADPVNVRRERDDGPSRVVVPSLMPAAAPAKSPVEELKASVTVFKEVAAVLNNVRQPEPERETPLETVRNAVNLVKDLNSYLPHNGGPDIDGGGNTVRDWIDGIASLGREFGLGQALNNVILFALQEAARKRAGAAVKVASPAGSAAGPPQSELVSSVQPASSAVPPPDPGGAAAEPRATAAANAAGLSLELIPPPMRAALEEALAVVVAELQRSELCEEYETEVAGHALREVVEAFPQAFIVLDYFMQQSSARVLVLLGSIKPEWESIVDLKGAAGFIEVLQDDWSEAKAAEGLLNVGGEAEIADGQAERAN